MNQRKLPRDKVNHERKAIVWIATQLARVNPTLNRLDAEARSRQICYKPTR